MNKPTVVLAEAEGFDAGALTRLEEHAVITQPTTEEFPELLGLISRADVLWVRLSHKWGAEALANAKRLRCIVSPTTGLGHLDLPYLDKAGIEVLSLQGHTGFLRGVRATAEMTLALMLATLRNIYPAANDVASGGWDRMRFRGREIAGSTVGLVGWGRVAQQVSSLLESFGPERILVHDPYVDVPSDGRLERSDLGALLRQSHLVSLHASADGGAGPILTSDRFNAMRPGAILINTARGELVDEVALVASLRAGAILAAGVDVVRSEQEADGARPLVHAAQELGGRLLITPHLGGCTVESMAATERFMVDRLIEFLENFRGRDSTDSERPA